MPEAHRRVAAMLFVNAKGELLLQLRDDKPDIRYPNHWGVIGGHVEAGESFEQALAREVAEEIELEARDFELWETKESAGSTIAMFAARLDTPAEALVLHEGQRVEYHSPQAAMMMPMVPWLLEALPRFVRSGLYARLAPEAQTPANAEAASVVFVNRNGELLLRLRDDKPGLLFPAAWDLIGGAMEAGETPEDAAVREVLEELGLVLEEFAYWGAVRGVVRIHVFLAPLDLPAERLRLTEGQRVQWFPPRDALQQPLVPYMERLIPDVVSTPPYSDLFASSGT